MPHLSATIGSGRARLEVCAVSRIHQSGEARSFMHGPRFTRALLRAAALIGIALGTGRLAAQDVVFSGRITSQAGQPLGGANVAIPELGVGTVATVEGRYNFTVAQSRVNGRTVNVVARYIGYKPNRLTITISGLRVEHDL